MSSLSPISGGVLPASPSGEPPMSFIAAIDALPTGSGGSPDDQPGWTIAGTLQSGFDIWFRRPAANAPPTTPIVYEVKVVYGEHDAGPPSHPELTWTRIEYPLAPPTAEHMAADEAARAAGNPPPRPPRDVYLWYASGPMTLSPGTTRSADLSPIIAIKIATDRDATVGAGFARVSSVLNPDSTKLQAREQLCYKTAAAAARVGKTLSDGDLIDALDAAGVWRVGRVSVVDGEKRVMFDAMTMKHDVNFDASRVAKVHTNTRCANTGSDAELPSFDVKKPGFENIASTLSEYLPLIESAVSAAPTIRSSIAPALDTTALMRRFAAPVASSALAFMKDRAWRPLHYHLTWRAPAVLELHGPMVFVMLHRSLCLTVDALVSSLAFSPSLPEDHAVWLLRALGGDARYGRVFTCPEGPARDVVDTYQSLLDPAFDTAEEALEALTAARPADAPPLLPLGEYMRPNRVPFHFVRSDLEPIPAPLVQNAVTAPVPRRPDMISVLVDRFCARGGLDILSARLVRGTSTAAFCGPLSGSAPTGVAGSSSLSGGAGPPAAAGSGNGDSIFTFFALVSLAAYLRSCVRGDIWAAFARRLNFSAVLRARIDSLTDADVKCIDTAAFHSLLSRWTDLLRDDAAASPTADSAAAAAASAAAAAASIGSSDGVARRAHDDVLIMPFRLAMLARQFATVGVLERRLDALSQLSNLCAAVTEAERAPPGSPAAAHAARALGGLTAQGLGKWVSDSLIIETLATVEPHERVIEASGSVIAFLARFGMLTISQVSALWQCVQADRSSLASAALQALKTPLETKGCGLPDHIAEHLVSKLRQVPVASVNEPLLDFIASTALLPISVTTLDPATSPAAAAAAAGAPVLHIDALDLLWHFATSLSCPPNLRTGAANYLLHSLQVPRMLPLLSLFAHRAIRVLSEAARVGHAGAGAQSTPAAVAAAADITTMCVEILRTSAPTSSRMESILALGASFADAAATTVPAGEDAATGADGARSPQMQGFSPPGGADSAAAAAAAAESGCVALPATAVVLHHSPGSAGGDVLTVETWPRSLERSAAPAVIAAAVADAAAAATSAVAAGIVNESRRSHDKVNVRLMRRLWLEELDVAAVDLVVAGEDDGADEGKAGEAVDEDPESHGIITPAGRGVKNVADILVGELSRLVADSAPDAASASSSSVVATTGGGAAAAGTDPAAATADLIMRLTRSRLDFLLYVLSYGGLRMSFKQVQRLWRAAFCKGWTLYHAPDAATTPATGSTSATIEAPFHLVMEFLFRLLPLNEASQPKVNDPVTLDYIATNRVKLSNRTADQVFEQLFLPEFFTSKGCWSKWSHTVSLVFQLLLLTYNRDNIYHTQAPHAAGKVVHSFPLLVGYATVLNPGALKGIDLLWSLLEHLPASFEDSATIASSAATALLLLHTRVTATMSADDRVAHVRRFVAEIFDRLDRICAAEDAAAAAAAASSAASSEGARECGQVSAPSSTSAQSKCSPAVLRLLSLCTSLTHLRDLVRPSSPAEYDRIVCPHQVPLGGALSIASDAATAGTCVGLWPDGSYSFSTSPVAADAAVAAAAGGPAATTAAAVKALADVPNAKVMVCLKAFFVTCPPHPSLCRDAIISLSTRMAACVGSNAVVTRCLALADRRGGATADACLGLVGRLQQDEGLSGLLAADAVPPKGGRSAETEAEGEGRGQGELGMSFSDGEGEGIGADQAAWWPEDATPEAAALWGKYLSSTSGSQLALFLLTLHSAAADAAAQSLARQQPHVTAGVTPAAVAAAAVSLLESRGCLTYLFSVLNAAPLEKLASSRLCLQSLAFAASLVAKAGENASLRAYNESTGSNLDEDDAFVPVSDMLLARVSLRILDVFACAPIADADVADADAAAAGAGSGAGAGAGSGAGSGPTPGTGANTAVVVEAASAALVECLKGAVQRDPMVISLALTSAPSRALATAVTGAGADAKGVLFPLSRCWRQFLLTTLATPGGCAAAKAAAADAVHVLLLSATSTAAAGASTTTTPNKSLTTIAAAAAARLRGLLLLLLLQQDPTVPERRGELVSLAGVLAGAFSVSDSETDAAATAAAAGVAGVGAHAIAGEGDIEVDELASGFSLLSLSAPGPPSSSTTADVVAAATAAALKPFDKLTEADGAALAAPAARAVLFSVLCSRVLQRPVAEPVGAGRVRAPAGSGEGLDGRPMSPPAYGSAMGMGMGMTAEAEGEPIETGSEADALTVLLLEAAREAYPAATAVATVASATDGGAAAAAVADAAVKCAEWGVAAMSNVDSAPGPNPKGLALPQLKSPQAIAAVCSLLSAFTNHPLACSSVEGESVAEAVARSISVLTTVPSTPVGVPSPSSAAGNTDSSQGDAAQAEPPCALRGWGIVPAFDCVDTPASSASGAGAAGVGAGLAGNGGRDAMMTGRGGAMRRPAPFAGLRNLSSTCYINAVLQQFATLPQLRENLLSVDANALLRDASARHEAAVAAHDTAAVNATAGELDDLKTITELQRLIAALATSATEVDPTAFIESLKDSDGNPIDPQVQEDSATLVLRLIDIVNRRLRGSHDQDAIRGVLGGATRSEMIGLDGCNHYRWTDDEFFALAVDIKGLSSVEQSLQSFVAPCVFDELRCDSCGKRVKTLRRTVISDLPDVLCLHLKRFEVDYEYERTVKLDDMLSFPDQLNLKSFSLGSVPPAPQMVGREDYAAVAGAQLPAPADDDEFMYRLRGVVMHIGNADHGHYFSFIRLPNTATKTANTPSAGPSPISGTSTSSAGSVSKPAVSELEGEGVWCEFNDSRVTYIPRSLVDQAGFGGAGPEGAARREGSAYMLFYDRVRARRVSKADAAAIERLITASQREQARLRRVSSLLSPDVTGMFASLVRSTFAEKHHQKQQQRNSWRIVESGLTYLFTALARALTPSPGPTRALVRSLCRATGTPVPASAVSQSGASTAADGGHCVVDPAQLAAFIRLHSSLLLDVITESTTATIRDMARVLLAHALTHRARGAGAAVAAAFAAVRAAVQPASPNDIAGAVNAVDVNLTQLTSPRDAALQSAACLLSAGHIVAATAPEPVSAAAAIVEAVAHVGGEHTEGEEDEHLNEAAAEAKALVETVDMLISRLTAHSGSPCIPEINLVIAFHAATTASDAAASLLADIISALTPASAADAVAVAEAGGPRGRADVELAGYLLSRGVAPLVSAALRCIPPRMRMVRVMASTVDPHPASPAFIEQHRPATLGRLRLLSALVRRAGMDSGRRKMQVSATEAAAAAAAAASADPAATGLLGDGPRPLAALAATLTPSAVESDGEDIHAAAAASVAAEDAAARWLATAPVLTVLDYAELAHPDLWTALVPMLTPMEQAAELTPLITRACLCDMKVSAAVQTALFPSRTMFDKIPAALPVPKMRVESLFPFLRALTAWLSVPDAIMPRRAATAAGLMCDRVIATNRYWRITDELMWYVIRQAYLSPQFAHGLMSVEGEYISMLKDNADWLVHYAMPIPLLGSNAGPVFLDPVELIGCFATEGAPRGLSIERKAELMAALRDRVGYHQYCALFEEAASADAPGVDVLTLARDEGRDPEAEYEEMRAGRDERSLDDFMGDHE